MTEKEINIKIHKALGWVFVPSHDLYISGQLQAIPETWTSEEGDVSEGPEPYCRDLNAIRNAELLLTDEQYNEFCIHLCGLQDACCYPPTLEQLRKGISAGPRERAAAFVKAIGK